MPVDPMQRVTLDTWSHRYAAKTTGQAKRYNRSIADGSSLQERPQENKRDDHASTTKTTWLCTKSIISIQNTE